MRSLICLIFTALFLFISCNDTTKLQEQIDSLKTVQAESYKPGFGEFMTYIQIHHSKLWFAGKNKNWELANFELNEVKETVDAIMKYRKEREETRTLPIIFPALDSLGLSIQQKNLKSFENNFTNLTNTCNSCHQAVKYGFNVVVVPDTSPFSNQDFSGNAK